MYYYWVNATLRFTLILILIVFSSNEISFFMCYGKYNNFQNVSTSIGFRNCHIVRKYLILSLFGGYFWSTFERRVLTNYSVISELSYTFI